MHISNVRKITKDDVFKSGGYLFGENPDDPEVMLEYTILNFDKKHVHCKAGDIFISFQWKRLKTMYKQK
jgi:hypothetical protein